MEAIAKILESLLKVAKQYGIASVIAMLAIGVNLYLVNNTIKQAQAHELADREQRTKDAATIAESVKSLTAAIEVLRHDVALSQDGIHGSLVDLSAQVRVLQIVSGKLNRAASMSIEAARVQQQVNVMAPTPIMERPGM